MVRRKTDTRPGGEDQKAKRARTRRIVKKLKQILPHAECSLDFQNPLQLLIATILSAQNPPL